MTPICTILHAPGPRSALVLSLFPGIGLLDRAFEEEGFCVVRGPDVLWGGDVRTFHPPSGVFDGVIGGPPCQAFSRLRHLNPLAGQKHGNLIPEFERVVAESEPTWFLMENVPEAPVPQVRFYWTARNLLLNNRWFGAEQQRTRRFSFATHQTVSDYGIGLDVSPDLTLFEAPLCELAVTSSSATVPVALGGSGKLKRSLRPPAVLAGHGDGASGDRARGQTARSIEEMCRLQGLPEHFLSEAPFTAEGKRQMLGNGVPLPMGRAIARAVKRAMGYEAGDAEQEHVSATE